MAVAAQPQIAARVAPDGLRPKLHVVAGGEPEIDVPRAERAVAELLAALGRDPTTDDLAETPRRVAASLAELLTPPAFTLTTFPNDEGYDELVLARSIPFSSICASPCAACGRRARAR